MVQAIKQFYQEQQVLRIFLQCSGNVEEIVVDISTDNIIYILQLFLNQPNTIYVLVK